VENKNLTQAKELLGTDLAAMTEILFFLEGTF
jgi:hypothetical protein